MMSNLKEARGGIQTRFLKNCKACDNSFDLTKEKISNLVSNYDPFYQNYTEIIY